jgi:uncharacterized protein
MKRDQVLKILTEHRLELRDKFGVKSLALFGSVARDEASQTSDVDLLVEFEQPVGYFHLFYLEDYLEDLLGGIKVDMVLRRAVIDELKETIYGEAIDVVG